MRWLPTLVFLCALPAVAGAESITVLGLEAQDAPESDAARLTEAMRQRLAAAPGMRVVAGKDYVEMKLVFDCLDDARLAPCMSQAGKSIGAQKLVFGTLRGRKGASGRFTLSLRLLDVASGTVEKYIPAEPVPATELQPESVNGLANRLLATLVGVETRTALTVTTDPPGANVNVDGQDRGPGPVTLADLPPGPHIVVVSQEGFAARTQTLNVQQGEAAKLEVRLTSGDGSSAATGGADHGSSEHPGRTATIVGGVTLVAAAAVAGVALYTWRKYSSLEDDANANLRAVQAQDRAYASANRAWFQNPSCSFPGPSPTSPEAKSYQSQCSDGSSYAQLTTGLVIGAGVLAGAGIVALAVGLRAHPSEAPRASLAPRLRTLTPVVSTSGGGVNATFEF